MAYEAILSNGDELADKSMALDSSSSTDGDILLDLDKWPNKYVITDWTTIDVAWLNNSNVFSKGYINQPNGKTSDRILEIIFRDHVLQLQD